MTVNELSIALEELKAKGKGMARIYMSVPLEALKVNQTFGLDEIKHYNPEINHGHVILRANEYWDGSLES